MRERRIKLSIGVAVAAATVALLLFQTRQTARASFDGRSVERWFFRYTQSRWSEDAVEREVAAAALREMGDDAVRFLVREAFRREPPAVFAKATAAIRRWLRLPGPEWPPLSVRRIQAVAAVGDIRPPAKRLLPLVKKALEQRSEQEYSTALQLLGKTGDGAEAAARLLAQALTHTNALTRSQAAGALAGLGPSARVALPAMMDALNRSLPLPDPNLLTALGNCGLEAGAALPALERLLLPQPPPPPQPGATVLYASGMVVTGNPTISLRAAVAIVNIQPDHGAAWATITNTLRFVTGHRRSIAPILVLQHDTLRQLESLDTGGERLAPDLSALATSDQPVVSWAALRLLQRLAPETAVPALLWNMKRQGNLQERCWAAGCLLTNRTYQAEARAFLLSRLADRTRERSRPHAALALANASPTDTGVVQALEQVAAAPRDPASSAAKLALLKLRRQGAGKDTKSSH